MGFHKCSYSAWLFYCVCSIDTHLPHALPTTPSVFDGQFVRQAASL